VFALDRFGGPSGQPTTTVLPGAVPFAGAFDARGDLALSEAGPNAVATFRLDGRGALVPVAQAPTGQAATGRITVVDGHLYLSNAGSGSVAAHLRDCSPCADDLDGLLAAVSGTPPRRATPR
jgi:streptogramin lyase